MGFHIEIDSILRSDEFPALTVGSEHEFSKSGSRVFFDGLPIWLTRSDWTALAEIRILSQTKSLDEVRGRFRVLHVYAGDEQAVLTRILRRMFAGGSGASPAQSLETSFATATIDIVYFDIGDTLGSAVLSAPPPHLFALNVYPHVPAVLQKLREGAKRLGLISNTGDDGSAVVNAVLQNCGLLDKFETPLLLYSKETGLRKDSPAVFLLAAERAGVPAERCLFVGEDASERVHAQAAGMKVCPHPLLVEDVLAGDALRYARISVPAHLSETSWRRVLRESGVLPLGIQGPAGHSLLAVISQRVATELIQRQFDVVLLGPANEPLTTDLFLVRDDQAVRTGLESAAGELQTMFTASEQAGMILSSTMEGVLVALPGGKSIESYHFAQTHHGHNEKLIADPSLLTPYEQDPRGRAPTFLEFAAEDPPLEDAARQAIGEISAAAIKQSVERYSGALPLAAAGDFRVRSRHIHSADMSRVVEGLAAELAAVGSRIAVRLHRFSHEGRSHENVEGEIAGAAPNGARTIVIVSAHLDSTAASQPGYHAATDPAPGADDDATGVAAVMAIARAFHSLPQPKHTVRFVLFNAEEHGLVGSKAYARDQALQGAPISAVYQMDMIGHNREAPPSFQVHAGFLPAPDVQLRSKSLGERVRRTAALAAPELPVPRLFISIGAAPQNRDPAESRSDHAAFQQRGYAACAVTEDFSFGPQFDDPTAEVNPHYHRLSDKVENIDFEYAAAIARTVAAAAWLSANA